MRIFKNKQFSSFSKKENISDETLIDTIKAAESGLIDAHYGGKVIKLRIARPNEGKSSGYRSIILYRQHDRAFFVYGFAKNEQENLSLHEAQGFKRLAKIMLSLSDEQINTLLAARTLEEINT